MRKKTLVLLNQDRYIAERNASSENLNSNWKTSTSTPHLYLPKINSNITSISPHSLNIGSIDKLQHHIHSLISQRQQQILTFKKQKQIKEDFENKKQTMALQSQAEKKTLYKHHIRHLQQKLKQLQGKLKVEQKKLEVESSLQEKMAVQYKQVYDTMHNRVRGANKRDEITQTQATETNIENTQKQSSNQNQKKNSGYFKRKFRIIGYVVYYSLAFPKYVKIFRQLRKQYFYQQVVNSQQLLPTIQDYIKFLSSLRLSQLQRQTERKSRKSNQIGPCFSFEEVDEEGGLKVKSIPVDSVEIIVLFVLSKIKEAILEGRLDSLLKCMSFLFISRSFLADHLYLIDQLYRLTINKDSHQIVAQKQQEIQLLMNFLIGKVTCFGFMIAGKKDKKILRRNSKLNNFNQSLARSLLLGGLFLFKKNNFVNTNPQLDQKQKRQGNVESLKRDELPILMSELEISEKFDLSGGDEKDKRTSIEAKIEEGSLNSQGLKFKNMIKTDEILNQFNLSSKHSQEVQELLREIGELVHKQCWLFRIQHFQEIEEHTLCHKFYLTKQIEIQDYTKKRLPNQLLQIETSISLIIQARAQRKNTKSLFQIGGKISKSKLSSSIRGSLNSRKSSQISNNSNLQSIFSKQNKSFEQASSKHQYRQSLYKHKGTKSGEIVMSEISNERVQNRNIRLNPKNREKLKNRLNKIDQVVEKDQKDQ